MKNTISKQFWITIIMVFCLLFFMVTYIFSSFYHSSVSNIEELGVSNIKSEAAMIDDDTDYSMRQSEKGTKNIFVVDDEIMNIKMVEYILKDEQDFKVIRARTKDETFNELDEQKIHLILLDLMTIWRSHYMLWW